MNQKDKEQVVTATKNLGRALGKLGMVTVVLFYELTLTPFRLVAEAAKEYKKKNQET